MSKFLLLSLLFVSDCSFKDLKYKEDNIVEEIIEEIIEQKTDIENIDLSPDSPEKSKKRVDGKTELIRIDF